MGMRWVWDGFHPREDSLDGTEDPWLWDELVRGFRIKVRGDERAQKSRLRLTLPLPGGTLQLCYIPPA